MATTTAAGGDAGLTRTQIGGLIALMLVSGCSNSLLSKFQDMQEVSPGKKYEQPVFQTLTMFAGETLCLAALLALRSKAKVQRASRSYKAKYSKLPVDDSGVVINASEYTLRDVDGQEFNGSQYSRTDASDYDDQGIHAHKAVVGPDELVPGEVEPVEVQSPKLQGTKTLLMWLPAIFDICGTTLMNVGLLWVPVSVYQMLRGALVLWVGLFSVVFLHRKLAADKWASLLVVMLGVAVVGLSNTVSKKPPPSSDEDHEAAVDVGKALIGALLVLFAQVFTASQFVIEEKIMTRYSVEPLKAVGLEGIFGLLTTVVLMPILFFTIGQSSTGKGGYFDVPTGFHETFDNRTIWLTSIAIACSIAFFNFSGLAVTKNVSATARSLLDTCRTIGIWAVSLFLGWEHLAVLQIVGFGLLLYGTLCFNEVIAFPSFLGFRRKFAAEQYAEVPSSAGNNGVSTAAAGTRSSDSRDVRGPAARPDRRIQRGDPNERTPLMLSSSPARDS